MAFCTALLEGLKNESGDAKMDFEKIQLKPTIRLIKESFGVMIGDLERGGVFKVLDPGSTYVLLKLYEGATIEELADIVDSEESIQNMMAIIRKYFREIFIAYGDFLEKTKRYLRNLNIDEFLYEVDEDTFLDAFYGYFRSSYPVFIEIIPTLKCHLNCFYCYIKHKRFIENVDPEVIIEALEELVKMRKIAGVRFIGGEPLLKKDFVLSIARYLAKHDVYVEIFTKYPINEELARKLSSVEVDRIVLSIDSLNNEYLKRITRVNLDLAELFKQSIVNLKKNGMRVCVNSTISRINVDEVYSMVDELITLGVDAISITGYLRSHPADPKELLLRKEDFDKIVKQAKRTVEKYPHEDVDGITIVTTGNHTTGIFYSMAGGFGVLSDYIVSSISNEVSAPRKVHHRCPAYRERIAILPNGDVIGCNPMSTLRQDMLSNLIIGNIKEASLSDIWNSEKAKMLAFPPREKFAKYPCGKCKYFSDCVKYYGFCFVKSVNFFGSIFAPSTECRYIQIP